MKKTLLPLLVMISISGFAQRIEWADFAVVNNLSPFSNAVATDPAGYIYSLNKYSGSVILQGDTIPPASAYDDCILVKYDSTGQVVWSKIFGGNWFDDVYKVAADGSGHVYVSCMIQTATEMSDTVYPCLTQYQVIQFDSGGHFLRNRFITGLGTTALAALGDYVYIAHENVVEKLDTSLNTVWSRTATAGTLTFYSTGDLYVTPGGRLIASGLEGSGGTVTFDTITFDFTPGGFDEVFVISMDTSGSASWGRALYPAGVQETTFGAAGDDAGNVYLTLKTANQMIFANDTLENPLVPAQPYNAVVRYDATGQEIWARALYPVSSSELFDVLVNARGEILLAGDYILGGASFGPINLPPSGGAVVLKLDSAGNALWAKHDVQTLPSSKHFKGLANHPNGYAAIGFFPDHFQLDCFEAGNNNLGFFTTLITENPVLNASFSYTISSAFTISFMDESMGVPVLWHWDFGDGDTSNQANPVHTYASAGNYTVTLTLSDGICTDSANVIFLNVSIPALTGRPDFRIYPNPGNQDMYVDGSHTDRITVFTTQGSEVIRLEDCSGMPLRISTDDLAPGIYLVRIESSSHVLIRKWTKLE